MKIKTMIAQELLNTKDVIIIKEMMMIIGIERLMITITKILVMIVVAVKVIEKESEDTVMITKIVETIEERGDEGSSMRMIVMKRRVEDLIGKDINV